MSTEKPPFISNTLNLLLTVYHHHPVVCMYITFKISLKYEKISYTPQKKTRFFFLSMSTRDPCVKSIVQLMQ